MHLLLGLLREDHALSRRFFDEKGGVQSLREEIEAHTTRGERISTSVEVPLSVESKHILNAAAEEAERLGNKHVTTEHLLLGILREKDSWAARLLRDRGLTLDDLREQISHQADESEIHAVERLFSVAKFAEAWNSGNVGDFAGMFSTDGQFVDPDGNLWIGCPQIMQAAKLVFRATGWTKTRGKIEDVQFVGNKAMMITLAWEPPEKLEKPNPGCVQMTVILIQKPEGWIISRVQATGIQPQSRAASV